MKQYWFVKILLSYNATAVIWQYCLADNRSDNNSESYKIAALLNWSQQNNYTNGVSISVVEEWNTFLGAVRVPSTSNKASTPGFREAIITC